MLIPILQFGTAWRNLQSVAYAIAQERQERLESVIRVKKESWMR